MGASSPIVIWEGRVNRDEFGTFAACNGHGEGEIPFNDRRLFRSISGSVQGKPRSRGELIKLTNRDTLSKIPPLRQASRGLADFQRPAAGGIGINHADDFQEPCERTSAADGPATRTDGTGFIKWRD